MEKGRQGARDAILRSVLTVLGEDGLDKVTHRNAAQKAGVSPGTVSYHFPARDDLIQAAFSQYVSDYQETLATAISETPLRTRDDLVQFLAGTTALSPDHLTVTAIEYEMALLAHRTPAISSEVKAWQRTMEPILSDVLETLGVARPIEAARLVLSVCRGTEFEVMARGVTVPREQFAARLNRVLDSLLTPSASM
ncbi:MAG: TetR/AcrR family transcriptional regulator [Pseudomonadota bacterium]